MSNEKKKEWLKSTTEMLIKGGVINGTKAVAEEMFEQYEGMTPEQAIAEELPYLSN